MSGFEDYYTDPMTDFTDKYNTRLSPKLEASYNQWLKTLPENQRSTRDYDLRGYFLAGLNGEDGIQLYDRENGQHFIDKFKKPNHPTFSDESIYHGRDGFIGGHWDNWGRGHQTFTPSETNMTTPEELAAYMKTVEPNIGLIDNRFGAYDPAPQGNSLYRGFVNFMNRMTRKLDNEPVRLPLADTGNRG